MFESFNDIFPDVLENESHKGFCERMFTFSRQMEKLNKEILDDSYEVDGELWKLNIYMPVTQEEFNFA